MRIFIVLILTTLAYGASYNQTLAIIQAKLAAITHCSAQQVQSWNCKICKEYPYLQNVTQIENTNTKISGFVGYDHHRDSIVISWRGTTAPQNWVEDLDFKQIDYKLDSRCSGCKVHAGFYNAYLSVAAKVTDKIAALLKVYATASFTITGHSLGGALAEITGTLDSIQE